MNLKKPALILSAIACCGALLAACGSDDSSSDPVAVNDVWTRVTAPTATMGAVYMNLESADGDRLVSVSVPADVAGRAEIHETVGGSESEGDMDPGTTMEGGIAVEPAEDDDAGGDGMEGMDGATGEDSSMPDAMMGMRELEDGLELPGGEEVSLEPGGYHIMLLELKQPIAEGDTIPVTLEFENAGEVKVEAEARSTES
jgi:hypothetical protein